MIPRQDCERFEVTTGALHAGDACHGALCEDSGPLARQLGNGDCLVEAFCRSLKESTAALDHDAAEPLAHGEVLPRSGCIRFHIRG
jgi:hypothetical protein